MNKPAEKSSRPPVIVVMGHVDHGKTTLLDYIRKTNVAAKESGGITQHIGAYEIEHNGQKITFLDTPGHEAFSKMRSRGAKVADMALLVVAADDGVKPQTKEAIQHIKTAELPFIVALNKIDKPNADPAKVKQELAAADVLVEGWGGDVPVAEISAKSGKGVDELLDLIALVSDLEERPYDPSKPAEGVVIESRLDSKKGAIATLLILNGTLKKGDAVLAGNARGKVRLLDNFLGESVESLAVSSPARVIGWETLPQVGDSFKSGALAELIAEKNEKKQISPEVSKANADIRLIIKADAAGSSEALEEAINKMPHEGIELAVLFSGVGNISESDVKFASAANAIILGFRVKMSREAEALMKHTPVRVIQSDIIYELIELIENEIKIIQDAKTQSAIPTLFEVVALFGIKNERQIIGGRVKSGMLKKGARANILRRGEKIGTGKIINLQKNKADVAEVEMNNECGVLFESEIKLIKGDELEIIAQ